MLALTYLMLFAPGFVSYLFLHTINTIHTIQYHTYHTIPDNVSYFVQCILMLREPCIVWYLFQYFNAVFTKCF